jgi:prevent-host-death family protein
MVFISYFCKKLKSMQVVSAREFRANQTKILAAAQSGQTILLTSRVGNFKIVPISSEDKIVEREMIASLKEVKDHIDGKIELQNARDIEL